MKKQAIIITVIVLAVLGLGIFLFIQDAKNSKLVVTGDDANTSLQGQEFSNLGQKHIEIGESHDPYNSNPPTSGPHYIQPADWGVYDKELQDEQLVHNLEHGGIWISYKDVDEQTKMSLEKIAKANPGSVVLTPRSANESKIGIASWTRLEKLEAYDESKILTFIQANKNKSPEPLAK